MFFGAFFKIVIMTEFSAFTKVNNYAEKHAVMGFWHAFNNRKTMLFI